MLKSNKLILVIYMIVTICFSTVVGTYIVAASNGVVVSGPSSVEEGQTITFNVNFADNVQNIWLSDGDIIKKGFSGTVNVNKVNDRNYTVVISNVSSVGANKYIMVNSGVGYIDGKPIDAVSSNAFEIKAKAVVDNGQNNNNKPENEKPQPQPQPQQPTKPQPDKNENNNNNNNNQEVQKPSGNTNNNTQPQKPSGNTNNTQKPNTNSNTNVNTNQNSNVENETSNVEDIQINTEEKVEEPKVLREIPNTGKIM